MALGGVAAAVGAAISDSSGSGGSAGTASSVGNHSSYRACLDDPKTTAEDCYAEFPEHSPSPATFGTTTTTTTLPVDHHVGDLISYSNKSDDSPIATLKIYGFNPAAGCTESFGCDSLNDGRPISAIDAEICATGTEPVPYNEYAFTIATSDNRQWDGSAFGGPQPELGSGDLQPGLCKRGWANVKGPTAGSPPITALIFAYSSFPMTRILP